MAHKATRVTLAESRDSQAEETDTTAAACSLWFASVIEGTVRSLRMAEARLGLRLVLSPVERSRHRSGFPLRGYALGHVTMSFLWTVRQRPV